MLVKDHDQVFLSRDGHFWPPGRTRLRSTAGHDVHLHLTDYQDRYYGGAALIRPHRFDLERSPIDVRTLDPWYPSAPYEQLDELAREEVELTGDADAFSVPVDSTERFAGFAPTPPRPARPARSVVVPGTAALLSRRGTSGQAGRTGGYSTTEPVADWSHILPLDTWWHLAVTSDGTHTVMHVDGCEVVRNPSTPARGIATVGRSWLVGGHEDGGRVDQVHHGWAG